MKNKRFFFVTAVVIMVLAMGAAGILQGQEGDSGQDSSEVRSAEAVVREAISYQGRLTSATEALLNGTYTLRFIVYDAAVGGTAVWDSGNLSVPVQNGLFNVALEINQADFNGAALWLSIIVAGETLSPRQELLPAPEALTLRPGADISGEPAAWVESVVDVELTGTWPSARAGGFHAPSTGTAVYADANGGGGIYGSSVANYGVSGHSTNGWGGYFSSDGGYGIRVNSDGTAHYDHGAYITSNWGYGIYVTSAQNNAVRAEAGSTAGLWQPSGHVALAGIGESRGVFGSGGSYGVYGSSTNGIGVYGNSSTDNGVYGHSTDDTGVYGYSTSNYGGSFYSETYRGVSASSVSSYYAGFLTNRGGSGSAGLYVDGSLTVTGSKSGYVVDVCLNDGPEPLEAGDVVAVVGVSDPVMGEIPVMRVVKATAVNASAVVGVVDQRFIVGAENGESLAHPDTAVPNLAANTAVQTGDYLSVATLGAFKVIKVDASFGAIQPGDLLTPSPNPGYAMRAAEATPGTIVGKALESLETGQGVIAVYVTLQ